MARAKNFQAGQLLRRPLLALAAACLAAPAAAAPAEPMASAAFLDSLGRAEALSKAGDWPAAAKAWEGIVAANPLEGRFWNALGTAFLRAKQYRQAIPALERSVALGYGRPANDAYNIACAFALLGEKDPAFDWLKRALDLRFLDLPHLAVDEDLASLRSDPRFAALVPVRDVGGMSREQGWRQDLDFLLWQIDRLGVAPYRLKPRPWFVAEFDRLAASVPARTDAQLGLDLLGIMTQVGDGHSGVMGARTEDWALTLPLQFLAFEEGIFITAADPKYRGLLGARVLRFGGRPVEEPMRLLAGTVSRDNDGPWSRLQAAYRLRHTGLLNAAGLIPERGRATLGLRWPDGRERDVIVEADTSKPDIWNMRPNPPEWVNLGQTQSGPDPLWLRDPGKNYWFEHLPAERSVYFAFNSVRDDKEETFAAFVRRLEAFIAANPIDRLIIDLRWNNGGNTHLLPPLRAAILRSDRINRRGRLFVLVGRRTFSAAQNAAAMLERDTAAIFVGEQTGSSPNFIGEEDPFMLPWSKLMVNVSHLAWQSGWPDDRRTWIAPLIHVPPTFAAYRGKRDPALEAILALPIPD